MRFAKFAFMAAAVVGISVAATTVVVAQNWGSIAKKAAGVEKKNIVETALVDGKFKTLLAAAKAAGLAETLSTGGPITLFAPTDEAFKKLPEGTVESLLANPDKLKQILLYHVVDGAVRSGDVVKLDSAKTLQGATVTVKSADGKVHINNATVTKADIECSNGVIHVIDTVLLPPEAEAKKSIVATASAAGDFKTLAKALDAAGLTDTLAEGGPYTVFAPTDAAFKKLPPQTLASLLLPGSKDKLKNILLAHVVQGNVLAADVVKLESVKTLSGAVLPVKVTDGVVTVGGATVTKTDVAAENGT
ncbi:fasciclin domain-containing protein, partial [bacterium]|nr:fasciclin domain-containing protein [bacterium]